MTRLRVIPSNPELVEGASRDPNTLPSHFEKHDVDGDDAEDGGKDVHNRF